MHELMERLEVIERKDKLVGIVLASALGLILFIVLLFWVANAGFVMGIQEPEWKTIGVIGPGGMDYGTDNMGSGDVNNFFDPSENPADRPPTPNNSNASASDPTPATNGGTPTTSGAITQTDPSPVTATSGQQESSKPDPKATTNGSNNNNSTPTNNNAGGSNDGETNTVGNHGDPRSTVLNPNGMFSFGEGIGGAGGRKPLKTPLSGYNVQLEDKITFTIVIDESGDVIFCSARNAIHKELVDIGKANLKNWKFEEAEPGTGNLTTTVTISFRLK